MENRNSINTDIKNTRRRKTSAGVLPDKQGFAECLRSQTVVTVIWFFTAVPEQSEHRQTGICHFLTLDTISPIKKPIKPPMAVVPTNKAMNSTR